MTSDPDRPTDADTVALVEHIRLTLAHDEIQNMKEERIRLIPKFEKVRLR